MLIIVGLLVLLIGLYLLALHYNLIDQITLILGEVFKTINSLDSPFTVGIILFVGGFALIIAGVITKRGPKP